MPRWLKKLALAFVRALVLALAIAFVPLPLRGELVPQIRVALASLFLICALGKMLFDTLFYNHYWP